MRKTENKLVICSIDLSKPQVQAKLPMVSKMNSSPKHRSIGTIRIYGNLTLATNAIVPL